MRIPIVVISALLLLTACNSREKNAGNAAETETSDTGQSTASKSPDSIKINDSSFTWTKKDQAKFLKECKAGSEQHLSAEKLEGFCTCMLTQSQKYYRNYREMEHESNDENDARILAGCARYVEEQDDDD